MAVAALYLSLVLPVLSNAAHAEEAAVLGVLGPVVDFSSCADRKLSLPADVETVKKSVLAVQTAKGFGSAVVVTPNGQALTAAHVVADEGTVTVRTVGGLELEAEVVWTDKENDLAVIDVAGKGHACLPLGGERLVTGADVFAIGSPADQALAFSVSKGVTSGYPTLEGRTYLQTDASLNPGNSGGPLLGTDAHVAAVVSWKVAGKEYEGLGFGVPADVVRGALSTDGIVGGIVGGSSGGAPAGKALVKFGANKPDVTIALATDTTASATTQYGNVNFGMTNVEDLCMAPCEQAMSPGVYNFLAYGEKTEPLRTKVEVKAGQTYTMVANTRPKAVANLGRGLVATGFTTAIIGGSLWGTSALIASSGAGSPGLDRAAKTTTILGGVMIGGGYGILGATKPSWDKE